MEVVPYNPIWKEKYCEEAEKIYCALKDEVEAIHHMGSTSIPGICAKPIIDILVEVKKISRVDNYNSKMQELGYIARGELGISGRRYFIKGISDRTHHVHMYQAENPEIGRHLRFRDYLIAHPEEAKLYEELKKKLANEYRYDPIGYTDGKTTFIQKIDRMADNWAKSNEKHNSWVKK